MIALKTNEISLGEVQGMGRFERAFLVVLICVVWLLAFNSLRVDWSINPQYNYGWVVPILTLGLFCRRWVTRPLAAPPRSVRGFMWSMVCLLGLLLPIRLLEEANPEWRLILWVHNLQAIGFSWCVLYIVGGKSWGKHFVFPLFFSLIAVPWPMVLEAKVVQGLMQIVATITVELVGTFHIPAVQHGNLIEINSGMVGVDEACSGVRSLQTTIFVGLFLGELYELCLKRRLILLGLGTLVALGANVGRTFYLVWSAVKRGLQQMEALHDAAGTVVVAIVLPSLWLLTLALRHKGVRLPLARRMHPAWTVPFGRTALFGALLWIAFVQVSTEVWYRWHESQLVDNPRWSIHWPVNPGGFRDVPIAETTRAILRCDEAKGVAWDDEKGNHWKLFHIRWKGGKNSVQLAKSHTPDICLQASGLKLKTDLGYKELEGTGIRFPFHQYVFESQGRLLHVFFCLWEDQTSKNSPTLREDGSQTSRLLAVLGGKRHLGQQVLELAVSGPATPEEAISTLQIELDRLIRPPTSTPNGQLQPGRH
ncbi:MAG: exosortase/archaeosortase family protein [Verrucomicrobiales bacterium]|nr:exosortase/archaeosortase family protein [Verrucomicrobiales bacterium]